MTASRIALNTLSRIVREAEPYGRRIQFLAETALQWLVIGKRCYVVNLSYNEQAALIKLGFNIRTVLREARGKKDLCEVTIR